MPHAWLEAGGKRVSTHDLTGADGRFVLITGSQGDGWAKAAAAAAEKQRAVAETAAMKAADEVLATSSAATVGKRWSEVRTGWEAIQSGGLQMKPRDNLLAQLGAGTRANRQCSGSNGAKRKSKWRCESPSCE